MNVLWKKGTFGYHSDFKRHSLSIYHYSVNLSSSHSLTSGQNIVESVDHDTHINSLALSWGTVLISLDYR